MHKRKLSLMFVLSFLLILGVYLTAAADEKPVIERGMTDLSPNIVTPDPRPTDEELHVDGYVPLEEVEGQDIQPTNEELEQERLTSKFNPFAGQAGDVRDVSAAIFSEDFEVSVPPAGWDFIATHGDTMTWYQDDYNPYSGSYLADCKYDSLLVPQDEWIITSALDFTAATTDLKMTFHFLMSYYWGVDPYDNYDIEVHAIVGTDTTLLWEEADFGVFTSWEWYEVTLSLAAYAGEAGVKFGFRYVGVDGAQGSFDLVSIDDDPPPPGRCCYGDPLAPDCADVTLFECDALGGVWDGDLNCTDNPCPVAGPGDNCMNPLPVTLPADMPYTDAGQYTCGRGNDYAETDMCYTYGYGGGEDMVYELTVTEEVTIKVTMDPKGTTWTYWEIRTECVPPNGSCITYYRNTGSDPYSSDTAIVLAAGTYYILVDTWPTPDCIEDFDFTIDIWTDPVGRCCYGDPAVPSCDDVTEAECITLGGTWDEDLNCTDNPCPVSGAPGDDCTDPIEVKIPGDLPFEDLSNYTCGRGNNYEETCLGLYDGGEDIIYWLDVESPIDLDITMDAYTTGYTGLAIGSACPPGDPCIVYSTGGTSQELKEVHLEPGSYYIMIDTWPTPDCIPQLDLFISESAGAGLGDACSNPILLKVPDDLGVDGLAATDSTCGHEDYYSSTCLGSYDGGEDVIFELDIDVPGPYDFVLDPQGTTYTGMAISDVCPLPAGTDDCLAKSTNSSSSPHGFGVTLDAGIYYLMIDTWPSPDCIPLFDLYIVPDTGTPPPNDNCEDVTPTTLTHGVVTTFTGDNTNATNDCSLLPSNGEAWEAFTIDEPSAVTIDYCGTTPEFELVFVVLATACPCDGGEVLYADQTDWDLCGDGNVTMDFFTLAPGTYYIPVLASHPDYPTEYYEGPYTINVLANPITGPCPASGGCDEYIMNVTVATINNTSDCEGYGDFTGQIAYMAPGASYPITVIIGNGYASDYGAGWIDWNQDMIFDEVTEAITFDIASGVGPYTGTVIVPMDAELGAARMRLRVSYSTPPPPCGATSYGEAEDYTVMVGGDAPELTVDPTEVDFGIVTEGETGSTGLTLGVDGAVDVDFTIDIVYNDKVGRRDFANVTMSNMAPEKAPYSGNPAPPPNANVIKQGGDDIASAVAITAMPFAGSGTTAGYTNDYDEVCPYSGSTAPDVVYSYTPTEVKQMDVSLEGSSYDTKVYVYEDGVGTLVGCNDDYYSDYTSALFNLDVYPGHTYYIVIDGYGTSSGGYIINADIHDPPDPFECPPGSIAESEACGDDTNGGCNMTTPTFEPINCGDTICGTVWADAGTRDTDWFILTMYETGPVTISGTAEFPFVMGFADTADCALVAELDPYAVGSPGEVIEITKTCGPGVYYLFVSHQDFYDTPCGTTNGYWFTASCDAGTAPILWLTADPTSGTVPGNGTLPLMLSYNTTGLEEGTYSADVVINHTGAKGTTIVPVAVEVGQPGNNIITIQPSPIFSLMQYTYGDALQADIYLGGEFAGGGHLVSEIDDATLQISGSSASMTPTSVEILESVEGFTGQVMKITCDMTVFINCYPLLWDVDDYIFTVDGQFLGGTPWTQDGTVTMYGHVSGDVNFDGAINLLDITALLNYMYKGGPAPRPVIEVGDINGDGGVNILDVTMMLNYLYKGGPAPTHP